MARGEMLMVFTYDISRNKTRRKVAKSLEDVLTRVQYSVFEGRLTRAKAEAIAQYVASLLEEGDSLRVYAIGHDGERRTRVYGDGAPILPDGHFWLV